MRFFASRLATKACSYTPLPSIASRATVPQRVFPVSKDALASSTLAAAGVTGIPRT
ncbi:MAG: hypothetical protein JKY56_26220 [Kofleriaceae bacterium]|nr:hypothetical protein [Kofleriaceae bacterium]